jgi:hypothetical protein
MIDVDFTVWDAPEFGTPRPNSASSQWVDHQLLAITIGRSSGVDSDDLADISVMSMDPSLAGETGLGMTQNALLSFSHRLTDIAGISPREAGRLAVNAAMSAGSEVMLTINGEPVSAKRHELPTGDWVVATVDPMRAVCVAGKNGVALPELHPADLTPWMEPLRGQFVEMEAVPPR